MHVNVNRLRGIIVERGLNGKKIAESLGINQSTYYRKLRANGAGFTISQVSKLTELLELDDDERVAIFFAH